MVLNRSIRSSDSKRRALLSKYQDRIEVNPTLSRGLVSYQSNRNRPYYRWFKYREGFSAALVEYFLDALLPDGGTVFDPFAGSGAALFSARERGCVGHGIELLPVGVAFVDARNACKRVTRDDFRKVICLLRSDEWRRSEDPEMAIKHLSITRHAFPKKAERDLTCFRSYVRERIANPDLRCIPQAACLSVLESISFTRKDGQYLRWDYRASRELRGKPFDKGKIHEFQPALERQLLLMLEDTAALDLFADDCHENDDKVVVEQGSCLQILPRRPDSSVDLVITSPPYCNRYDYTRTYALELAFLGVDEVDVKRLRQELLSCTVENKSKVDALRAQYQRFGNAQLFDEALRAFEGLGVLHEVLDLLDHKRVEGLLNNTNVPRMVRNYFLESSIVIFEMARIVKAGGGVVMVNDNVQYAGEEVPVDLILSELAEQAGFTTERIWTLARGKGNSSQQMGAHGRKELRKCAYVWRRR